VIEGYNLVHQLERVAVSGFLPTLFAGRSKNNMDSQSQAIVEA
jgi:hypothetical protein